MKFLHDRIGQIGQDHVDDLQARAEIFRKSSARPASRAYDRILQLRWDPDIFTA
jgi:hypothetical protein